MTFPYDKSMLVSSQAKLWQDGLDEHAELNVGRMFFNERGYVSARAVSVDLERNLWLDNAAVLDTNPSDAKPVFVFHGSDGYEIVISKSEKYVPREYVSSYTGYSEVAKVVTTD